MGWNTQTYDNESSANTVDDAGIHFNESDYRGLLALSSFTIDGVKYDNSNYRSLFEDIDSFKIDLTFSYTGNTYGEGGTLNERRNGSPLLKLSKDTDGKLIFNDRECWNQMYFTQEAYGRRHIDGTKDIYADTGTNSGTTQEGGIYNISTYNSSLINQDEELHYIVYVADGWLGCYLTDESGDLIINYAPIDISGYSLSPSDITSIYLGGSRFSWSNHSDLSNIAYKSIEIYKGVSNNTASATQTDRTKYLYTYFTGNSTNGESLHYALSDDGVNFKPVNNGLPVWDSSARSIEGSYPSDVGTAASKHVRDPYILQKRTAAGVPTSGYYILATDLNTQNGSNWGNNSKMLVYSINDLTDIDTATPWEIDTQAITAVSTLTSGTVSRAWAPQAIWDPAAGKYMLYWSVGYVGGLTKVYYLYTSDFKTDLASAAVKQLVFPSFCNSFIDADITYYNGLYYMFFKDEDAKKIYRAISPNASGPYQGFTKFSDTGMEGPQLYEITDGSYALMTDVYGSGGYNIYRASAPRKINESEVASTNINYLSPRHGSVVRITPAEYNAIVAEYGTLTPNTVEYYWANDANFGSENPGFTMKDTAGHDYEVAWYRSGGTTGGNKLILNAGGVHSADSQMCNIVTGDQYTVDFTFKGTVAGEQDDNHTVFSISKAGNDNANKINYVRISANGKFYVNATEVSCTSVLATAVKDTSASHNYKVTFNGYATCLLVDGTYVGGVINTTAMPSDLWMTFGWGRSTTIEDYRMSGEYGKVTISPTATDIGETAEDALLDTIRPDKADITTAPTFNFAPYQRKDGSNGSIPSDYYSNLVYSSVTDGVGDTVFTNELVTDRKRFKFAAPGTIVGVYDGVTSPSYPVVLESYASSPASSEIIHYLQPYANSQASWDARKVEYRYKWYGYGTNYQYWPTESNDSFSKEAYEQKNHTNFNARGDQNEAKGNNGESDHQGNTSTHRFWRNSLQFYAANANFGDNYYDSIINPNMEIGHSSKGGGINPPRYFYYKQATIPTSFYVINYKPIYDVVTSNDIVNTPRGNMTASALYDYLMGTTYDGEALWMYTTASRIGALIALKEIADCNPNNYDFSSNTETTVQTCAAAIKKAYQDWEAINLIKKSFTITYDKYGTDTVNDPSETVTAGNTLAGIPSNTAPSHINGSNCHWAYQWTSSNNVWDGTQTPSGSHVPHSNETYVETRDANVTHCSYSDWNDEWDPTDDHTASGWTHTAAAGDANGYSTGYCSVCTGSERVYDAHDTEWAQYESNVMLQSSTRYTTSSRAVYSSQIASTISGVTAYDETKSASYIDAINSTLSTAASTYLNPLAEFDLLYAKQSTYGTNNQDGSGNQKYTVSTWDAFKTAYDNGVTYHTGFADTSNVGKFTVNASNQVTGTKSEAQNNIETYRDATAAAEAVLTAAGDTDSYDAVVELLKYQDMSAVDSTYIDNVASPYGIVAANGTNAASVTFTMGGNKTITTATFDSSAPGKTYVQYAPDGVSTDIYTDASQAEIDARVAAIKTALSEINAGTSGKTAQYTVTFQKVTNNGSPVTVSTTNYYYGTSVTLNKTDANTSAGWGIQMDSTTSRYPAMDSYTFNVQGNTTVTSYETTAAAPEGQIKVTIGGVYSGSVLNEFYVDPDATITLASGTVTVQGYTPINVNTNPYYSFSSWGVNDSGKPNGTYTASELASDGAVWIHPRYNTAHSATALTISLDGVETVSTTEPDTLQEITATNSPYAIAAISDGNVYVVAYGDTFKNYLVASLDLYTITTDGSTYSINSTEITDPRTIEKLDGKLPFVYSYKTPAAKFTTYSGVTQYAAEGTYAKPAGVTIVECGTVYAQGTTSTWNNENFIIGGSGVYKNQAKNPNATTGQYYLAINTSKSVVTRGFVKYSYTTNGTTITTIDYCNICSNA